MNVIEFTAYPARDEPHTLVVGARIDGSDLRTVVAEVVAPLWALELDDEDFDSEIERDRFLLECHGGLPAQDVAWPSRHFLGEVEYPDYSGYEPGELALLGCGCGIWGCWPLLARITVDPDAVTWTGFRQPLRPGWGVLRLGPFRFDRTAYVERLASPTVLDADPLDPS
ncbi:hypothetical protein I0C86_14540 [Plantactinospora sp. S1510]|uniref:Uncharacterized protein n=1 Tax=Plantactinospora alkalitolerans TaxID=2789879 RepID=A0ABS0GW46_9ACTN|nr:hypothetical protein [Plantactinospora alkalitolerans]MBF9130164.1 hypothetical protein [Plantactinospora alkalitolerans]